MDVWGSSKSIVSHSVLRRRAKRIFLAREAGTRSSAATKLLNDTGGGWEYTRQQEVSKEVVSSELTVGGPGLGASEIGGVDGMERESVLLLHWICK